MLRGSMFSTSSCVHSHVDIWPLFKFRKPIYLDNIYHCSICTILFTLHSKKELESEKSSEEIPSLLWLFTHFLCGPPCAQSHIPFLSSDWVGVTEALSCQAPLPGLKPLIRSFLWYLTAMVETNDHLS
jgi:hypothetical protein